MHRATVSPEVMPHNSSQWSHVNARKKKKENTKRENVEPRDPLCLSRFAILFRFGGPKLARSASWKFLTWKAHCAFVTPRGATRPRESIASVSDSLSVTRRVNATGRVVSSRRLQLQLREITPRRVTLPTPLAFKCSRIRRAFLELNASRLALGCLLGCTNAADARREFRRAVSRNPIKEKPGELQDPLAARRNSPESHRAPRLGPSRTEDSSRTKFQRFRLLPPEIIRSLSSHFSSLARGAGRERSRVVPRCAGRTEITRAGSDVYDRSEP